MHPIWMFLILLFSASALYYLIYLIFKKSVKDDKKVSDLEMHLPFKDPVFDEIKKINPKGNGD